MILSGTTIPCPSTRLPSIQMSLGGRRTIANGKAGSSASNGESRTDGLHLLTRTHQITATTAGLLVPADVYQASLTCADQQPIRTTSSALWTSVHCPQRTWYGITVVYIGLIPSCRSSTPPGTTDVCEVNLILLKKNKPCFAPLCLCDFVTEKIARFLLCIARWRHFHLSLLAHLGPSCVAFQTSAAVTSSKGGAQSSVIKAHGVKR